MESKRKKKNSAKYKKLAKEIKKAAAEAGIEENYFFSTTFDRYVFQLSILEDLEETIEEEGNTVSKEYVKGRANVYTHPAISEYNKTSTAANQTVKTLIEIIKNLRQENINDEDKNNDPLGAFLKAHR